MHHSFICVCKTSNITKVMTPKVVEVEQKKKENVKLRST
jgi:hypothetical protein